MRTKDGRHFEVDVDEPPSEEGAQDPENDKVDTKRGVGDRSHTLLGDPQLNEALERAPTQEFQTGNVHTAGEKPVSVPRQIPSVHPTEQFFLTGRVRADTNDVPTDRRGRVQVNTFLGLGHALVENEAATLPSSLNEVKKAVGVSSTVPEDESFAMGHARRAILRTMNFLNYLILKSPKELRASLEERKENLIVPKHLPEDDEIQRFEYYAQTFGYYGPVLWFIPSGITLDDMVSADLLNEDWWRSEPNFPNGFQTLSPFDPPLGMPNYREPGYWALAIPGLTPGTTGKKFDHTSLRLTDFVRMSGFDLSGDTIHPKHRMLMKVLTVPNVLLFCAIAQHAKELISHVSLIARTATIIRTHQEVAWDSRSGKSISVTAQSLHRKCRACVQFSPDEKLRITDWVDDAPSQAVGMIIFAIPHIYD
jgi:hypothetical protein